MSYRSYIKKTELNTLLGVKGSTKFKDQQDALYERKCLHKNCTDNYIIDIAPQISETT